MFTSPETFAPFRSPSDMPILPVTKTPGELQGGVFLPADKVRNNSHVPTSEKYDELYRKSVEHPEKFWGDIADEFHWVVKPSEILRYNFDISKGNIFVKWFDGGKTNAAYNCLDRQIEKGLGDSVVFHWEGSDPRDEETITYSELLRQVCQMANVLKDSGVQKGDCVAIYLPMVVEIVVSALACARLGATHCVIFGGFASEALATRVFDTRAKIIITADGTWRGDKYVPLKEICDKGLEICRQKNHTVEKCIVLNNLGRVHFPPTVRTNTYAGIAATNGHNSSDDVISVKAPWVAGRDFWWHELMMDAADYCEPEWVDAEHPLFILYTSGSTGKPKGVVHTTGGYMIYSATTFKYAFDYHVGEMFFGAADIGWVTGHTFGIYGPLLNGATSVLFEGVPFYPDSDRYWDIIDKYGVEKFYTAPTAIRMLMKFGEEPVKRHKRDTLQVLGTMGEPINPKAWFWYYNVVGNGECSIVDTYWQTETAGPLLTPFPGWTPAKPGAAAYPFFGIVPVLLSDNGEEIEGPGEGYLAVKRPWPSIARTVNHDHDRYETEYFSKFPGYYLTGDGGRRDLDGYLWVTGRIDDKLNVSGHLLCTAHVESALVHHPDVAEAAAVSLPHPIKGECLYCFVTLIDGATFDDEFVQQLRLTVREQIGAFAMPDYVQNAPTGLPKTRSGKILRRILKKVARDDHDLGDVSTLLDNTVIEHLYHYRPANVPSLIYS